MSRLFSRRKMIGAGGAVALSPMVFARTAGAATDPTGPLTVLNTPVRLYDSRVDMTPLGGAKLETGSSVIVTASAGESGILMAAFVNVTVTQTEGRGFLRLTAADSSGEQPAAETSNINWLSAGLTIGNMALTAVGSENGIDVFAGGSGRTHVIVDLMGYIPFPGSI
jgi:hypothetical protein